MNRFKSYVPFVILASYALICLLLFVDSEWHPGWDSGIYLSTARNLANSQGYTYLDQPFFLKTPGFSYFLSWIVNPDGDFDFYKLNLVMMFLAMGTLAAVYVVMRQFQGKMSATCITLLLGTSPLFVRQFNEIMSEFLFLLLFFLGVWFILPPRKNSQNSIWRGLIGAVLVSGSLYVRSVGLVLLPGIIALSLHKENGARKLIGVVQVLLILLLLMPWIRFSLNAAEQAPKPSTQLLGFNYTTVLLHVDSRDPASPYFTLRDWAERISQHSLRLSKTIGQNILRGTGWRASVATIFVCVGFLFICLKGRSILEWFAVSYTCVIILYPYYNDRLVLPLVPLFFYYPFATVSYVAAWCEMHYKKKHLVMATCLVVLALILPFNLKAMRWYLSPNSYKERAMPLHTAAQWIKTHTPKDAIILHRYAPAFAILTGRRVYSYLWLPKNHPLPEVDYVVLVGKTTNFEPHLKKQNLGSVILHGNSKVGDIRIYRIR